MLFKWPFGRRPLFTAETQPEIGDAAPEIAAPQLTLSAPSAFLRLAADLSYLRPAEPGETQFRQWLSDIGETPEDGDIPSLYADMAELCGWPMAEVAEVAEIVPPAPPAPVEKYSALSGREAARQFLSHLRDTGQCGTYGADELAEVYSVHAREINRHETPVNTLRKEMAKLPGVMRCVKDDPRASGKSKRRSRTTTWTIIDISDFSADAPETANTHMPVRLAA